VKKDKTLVLVDAGNMSYRSHFAHLTLTTSDRRPTGILFGMLRALLQITRRFGRDVVFCWDYGIPGIEQERRESWRKKYWPDYKANRKRDPDVQKAYNVQTPTIRRLLRTLGYRNIGVPGLEADDIIGLISGTTYSCRDMMVVSGDHDLYQLLAIPGVSVVRPDDWKVLTGQEIVSLYGFPVSLWKYYLALGGDQSDNIKAIPGMGPKKAAAVLKGESGDYRVCINQLVVEYPALYNACQITAIPTEPGDERLQGLVDPEVESFNLSDYHRRLIGEMEYRAFYQFCTAYEMRYFMQERKRFF
jgi:5'-3' exonuclease